MAVISVNSDDSARTLENGSLTLILQAHVPYVLSHGHYPHGPNWLFEAVAETYIPLLNLCQRLAEDHAGPWFTIALSPVLCDQLSHLEFATQFEEYLQRKIAVSQRNEREFAAQGLEAYRDLAFFWENWYTGIARDFTERYGRTLLDEFRSLQENGFIEIITTTATHADLTSLATPEANFAQIRVAVDTYKKYFARQPRGICLVEKIESDQTGDFITNLLQENGFDYYVDTLPIQTHDAQPNVANGTESGEMPEGHELLQRLVNDTAEGYSCDGVFLDFHKRHFPGDLRLWRITDESANPVRKEPYEPFRSGGCCEALANHFIESAKATLSQAISTGSAPNLCISLNAALLGHRWFEGINWLSRVLKKLLQDSEISLTFGSETLNLLPSEAGASSGELAGDHEVSLLNNRATAWIHQEVQACEREMVRLSGLYGHTPNPKLQELLDQCARELLLMQSSDWPLLIATTAARDYAELRCAAHINVFRHLATLVSKISSGEFMSEGERCFVEATRERDNCFPDSLGNLWLSATGIASGV